VSLAYGHHERKDYEFRVPETVKPARVEALNAGGSDLEISINLRDFVLFSWTSVVSGQEDEFDNVSMGKLHFHVRYLRRSDYVAEGFFSHVSLDD
jgi:hypothetical protein